MMQSMLLTSPSKAQNNERLSDSSSVDDDVSDSGSLAEEGEVKSRFSDLFDSLLVSKGKEGKDAVADEEAEQEGEIERAIEQVEGEVEPVNIDAQENIEGIDYIEGTELEVSDLDASARENSTVDKSDLVDGERLDDYANVKDAGRQTQAATLAQSSILEQIETAKKIDTQVTEAQKTAKMGQGERVTSELSNQLKNGQEKEPSSLNESLLAAKRSRLKTSDNESKSEGDALKAEAAQTAINKIEISTLGKSDIERSPLATTLDANPPRSGDVANINKVINQNIANATQSSALHQPLDLQAKHASALLGERILMMIGQGKQAVNIRLDPAELGSMVIKLQVQQDQVQLTIHTQVAQSRDIIEQNLPRLREQLAQQGISLGDTSVEQQNQQQQQNHQGQNGVQERGSMLAGDSVLQANGEQTEWIASKIALPAQGIDYYA